MFLKYFSNLRHLNLQWIPKTDQHGLKLLNLRQSQINATTILSISRTRGAKISSFPWKLFTGGCQHRISGEMGSNYMFVTVKPKLRKSLGNSLVFLKTRFFGRVSPYLPSKRAGSYLICVKSSYLMLFSRANGSTSPHLCYIIWGSLRTHLFIFLTYFDPPKFQTTTWQLFSARCSTSA